MQKKVRKIYKVILLHLPTVRNDGWLFSYIIFGGHMNYRQWKKKYKKENGCNPRLAEDKRKKAKVVVQALDNIDINEMAAVIKRGFAQLFRTLSKAIGNIADQLGEK